MEVQGYAEIGRWCPLGTDLEVLVEPTKRAKRVRITLKPRERKGKVRTIYRSRNLTRVDRRV